MRTAETQRHAEALAVPHADVGTQFSRRAQQRQSQQISCDNEESAGCMNSLSKGAEITHGSECVWTLDKDSSETVSRKISIHISDFNADTNGTHASANHINVLRMAEIRYQHAGCLGILRDGKSESLGASGSFIEQRCIGHIERGQITDHGLKVQERLESALRNLGLIRRVSRVPTGILQNVPPNDGRRKSIVIPHADERAEHLI